MRIRPATIDDPDLDTVASLRLAFLREVHGVDGFDRDFVERTTRFVREHARSGALHSWLAAHDGVVAGVVSLLRYPVPPRPGEPRDFDGYVINLYVERAWRTNGVGRRLLDACLAADQDLQVRRFFLLATDDGRPLYESTGFRTNDRLLELPR